ncbi:MAG TPA: hypothetical protein VFV75_06275 [Candidatus Polarisedimenticolaceae bacterium]|nr:hypothetical protein [Candidatus Polarisedimenticolaceae bacterium]
MDPRPLTILLALSLLAGCTATRRPAPADPRDAQLQDAGHQIAELQSRNMALASEAEGAREDLATARREAQSLGESLSGAREALFRAEQERERVQQAHALLRTENDSLSGRTGTLAASVQRMRAQLAARARELADRDDRLAMLQRDLTTQRSANRSLEGLLASLRGNRSDLMAQLEAAVESRRLWIAVLGTLLLLVAALAVSAFWSRRRPGGPDRMRVHVGDEVRP